MILLPIWAGVISFLEILDATKEQKKDKFFLSFLELAHPSFFCPETVELLGSGLQILGIITAVFWCPCLWTWTELYHLLFQFSGL